MTELLHTWVPMYGSHICKVCGAVWPAEPGFATLAPHTSCKEQQRINATHIWQKVRGHWRCEVCGITCSMNHLPAHCEKTCKTVLMEKAIG